MNVSAGVRDERVVAGRLAGLMFAGGALLSIPSSLLMKPSPDSAYYVLTLVGVATGLVCLRLPWQRLPYSALHVVPVVATIEVALVIATFDELYGFFFPLIMVYVALISPSRKQVLPHFLIISAAIFLPVAYESSEHTRECLYQALFLVPVVATAGGMAIYLREELERNMRGVELLAGEAYATAARIWRIIGRRSSDGPELGPPAPVGSDGPPAVSD